MGRCSTHLKSVKPGRTVVFSTPLSEEGETLVRTGTIANGSCFYAALLHACSKDYATMNETQQVKFVQKLRADVASKVSKAEWMHLGNGHVASVPFQTNVYDILMAVYNEYQQPQLQPQHQPQHQPEPTKPSTVAVAAFTEQVRDHKDLFGFIPELAPFSVLESDILPKVSEHSLVAKGKDTLVSECVRYVAASPVMLELDPQRREYITLLVTKFFTLVAKVAEDAAYSSYVQNLRTSTTDTDSYTIETISNHFKRDVYIVDSKSRLPYMNAATPRVLQRRKSVIVLWIDDNHYEVVGRLLPENRVQREFSPGDPLIDRMYLYLMDISKFCKKYPSYTHLLPVASDAESSSGSDEEDDHAYHANTAQNSIEKYNPAQKFQPRHDENRYKQYQQSEHRRDHAECSSSTQKNQHAVQRSADMQAYDYRNDPHTEQQYAPRYSFDRQCMETTQYNENADDDLEYMSDY